MPATTPPKGRPTSGRRQRQTDARRARSRSTVRNAVWLIVALLVVALILVFGSGTGGNGNFGGTTSSAPLTDAAF